MKAMVLCAGFGTRLGELTREMPKPMLPLGEYPMLAYILANLRRHGFTDIIVNLHFKPEIIRDYFGDGSRFGVKLSYRNEPELLGTAGGLKNVASFFQAEETFLVHYGDVVTDQDFTRMLQFHREHDALATLLLHQRAKSNSVVTLDEAQRITGFLERPTEAVRSGVASSWVNSGVCLCRPGILEAIPEGGFADLPKDVFQKLAHTGRLRGCFLSGYRCAVDSPERLAQVRRALTDGTCRIPMADN